MRGVGWGGVLIGDIWGPKGGSEGSKAMGFFLGGGSPIEMGGGCLCLGGVGGLSVEGDFGGRLTGDLGCLGG